VLLSLTIGGIAGALTLLLMTWLFRPAAVRQASSIIRRTIGAVRG